MESWACPHEGPPYLTPKPSPYSLGAMTLVDVLRRLFRGKEREPIDYEHKVPHLGAYEPRPPDQHLHP